MADEHCAAILTNTGEATASAGILANLWGSSDSLKIVSSTVVTNLLEIASQPNRHPIPCPKNCSTIPAPVVQLHVEPQQTVTQYPDAEHCQQLQQLSKVTPLIFETTVSNQDELMSWIQDLSRGRGQHGEALYAFCDKSCSPSYAFSIVPTATQEQFQVQAQIQCGHARDRDHNKYSLAYGLYWRCHTLKSPAPSLQ
jgi:hypothetical protein